jgi:hypothetical protein
MTGMRRSAKALLSVVAAIVPALVAVQGAQPAHAAAASAEFSIEGKGGFSTGAGTVTIDQPKNAKNEVGGATRTDLHWVLVPFTINDGAGFRSSNVVVAVSDTQVLSSNVGVWQENAVGLRPGVPGIRFDGCETETGRFIVDQFTQSATAPFTITKLVVRFEHHCNGTTIGSLAWGSDPGAAAYAAHRLSSVSGAALAGGKVDFGTVNFPASAQSVVRVTNTGERALDIAKVSLEGYGIDDFTSTGCQGSTVAIGASCDVTITSTPQVDGPTDATLRIFDQFTGADPSNPLGAGEAISLHANGVGGNKARVELDGEDSNAAAPGIRVVKTGTFAGSNTSVTVTGTGLSFNLTVPGGMASDGVYTIGSNASLTMTVDARACTGTGGRVHIIELAGAVSRLVARFTVDCGNARNAIGQVLFAPSSAVVSRIVSPTSAITFAAADVGQSSVPKSVSVTNQGSASTVVTARLTKFSILSNGCVNATLAPGKSCAVVVAYSPVHGGGGIGAIAVKDTFSDNQDRRVFLQGAAGGASGGYPWNVDGEFVPVSPTRILDTREDASFRTFVEPLHAGEPRLVDVAGKIGKNGTTPVPAAGAGAAVLNVTVDSPTAAAYLTVYPTTGANTPPTASNLNFVRGQTTPNLVVAQLGDGGRVSLYTNAGDVHVIVDVVGWITSDSSTYRGSRLEPIAPTRILDTRIGTGGRSTPLGGRETMKLQVADPLDGYTAAVINLTGVEATASTFVTAFPADVTLPTASNLNLVAGQIRPNLVMVQLSADGAINLYNFAGNVNLVADLVGLYKAGGARETQTGRIKPFAPVRIVYTPGGDKLAGGTAKSWDVGVQSAAAGLANMETGKNTGFIANFTATEGTASTFMTAYPSDKSRPTASNLNVLANENVPNLAVVSLSAANTWDVYNHAGLTHYIFDVVARIAA